MLHEHATLTPQPPRGNPRTLTVNAPAGAGNLVPFAWLVSQLARAGLQGGFRGGAAGPARGRPNLTQDLVGFLDNYQLLPE